MHSENLLVVPKRNDVCQENIALVVLLLYFGVLYRLVCKTYRKEDPCESS